MSFLALLHSSSTSNGSMSSVCFRSWPQLAAVILCLTVSDASWIDPDTPIDDYVTSSLSQSQSLSQSSQFDLVFSDEFNTDGRHFMDGHDPRWTAVHKDDYTNDALQFYSERLASTRRGFLNLTTIVEDVQFDAPMEDEAERRGRQDGAGGTRTGSDTRSRRGLLEKDVHVTSNSNSNDESGNSGNSKNNKVKRTKNYQSAMLQSWNKFCFTGGIVEISAQLPGSADIGGLWPAMWLLGNLARATYVGSSNNIWPWSYNTCNKKLQHKQSISACNLVNHFDLHSKEGRGSPEIDIIEAMAGKEKLFGTPVNRPYYSASLQVSPGVQDYRPITGQHPESDLWYNHDLKYGRNSSLNIFFYGMHLEASTEEQSYFTDALSANRGLEETHFKKQHKYRLEWKAGKEGYITWYLDDELVYHIGANALNKTGAIIPEEPMYLLFNTAISKTWGFPTPCPFGCSCSCFDCRKSECLCGLPPRMATNFPAYFLIDYVRVYQNKNDSSQIVGCSTPTHPTKRFIQGHKALYMKEGDTNPLKTIKHGGGRCEVDFDCGREGSCKKVHGIDFKQCVCNTEFYTGPHCLSPNGHDDIDWDPEKKLIWYSFIMPKSLLIFIILIVAASFVLVVYKYLYDARNKDKSGYSVVQNYVEVEREVRNKEIENRIEMRYYQQSSSDSIPSTRSQR